MYVCTMYCVFICRYVLVAVVLFLCIVKTCTVNGSLGGNDETRVNDTNPSDSLAEVLLLNNRTPNMHKNNFFNYLVLMLHTTRLEL